jgi:GWxTD domain-containing protein
LTELEIFGRYNLLFLGFLLLLGCKLNKGYTSKPTKSLSNPDSDLLEVNAVAYHINDSVTKVYFQVNNENLLYKRPDTSLAFYADLKISYRLLSEPISKKILDSSSVNLIDRSDEENISQKHLITSFNFKSRRGNTYYLEFETLDRNKKTKYTTGIPINKLDTYSDQNFLVTVRDSVAFKNHFPASENVVVKFVNPAISQVTVDCFLKEFGPALPPFSIRQPDELKYKPDSVFYMDLSTNSFLLHMPAHGFYHARTNASSSEGLTLYTFESSFPGVSNSDEMISCTRYIMEKSEFESCKNSTEQKAAIDKFWLTIGGSNERARELLKRYYGRVKEANKYYTSYTQGWKSDRGMIYIIFGPPTNTYRSKKDEIWVYGNEANPAALRFIFNKTPNPFSNNDYILERSQFYKDAWYTAVEYWRQGNIYTDTHR